jgi:hypothetical protein
MHHDVHLRKMITEYAQMLSTAHRVAGYEGDFLYKTTHVNHPCNKWIRQQKGHYLWLYDLYTACINEYEYRHGKIHSAARLMGELSKLPKDSRRGDWSNPPLCMPDEYKIPGNAIGSYQRFYRHKKMFDKNGKFMGKYTKRTPPVWFVQDFV